MKKNIKLKLLSLLFLGSLFITSCGYEPVYYGIMHDVAPEEATMNGNITSIARAQIDGTEYLFLTGNGALKYKALSSAQHGDWKTYKSLPFSLHYYNYFATSSTPEGHIGQQILKIVSDADNIYLLTVSYKTNTSYGIVLPDTFYLWTKPLAGMLTSEADNWTNLGEGEINSTIFKTSYNLDEGEYNTYFNIFSTNTPQKNNRKAFLRVTNPEDSSDSTYYTLNGSSALVPDSSIGTSNYLATTEGNTRVNSAFYIGSQLYFSDSHTVITNETATQPASYACLAEANTSYNAGNKLYLYNGTNMTELISASAAISSLALTADSLIIGEGSYTASYTSNGGIERVLLDDSGMPEDETSEFTTNAKYQFTSTYIVMTLLCADPSKTEEEACLYATISYRGSGSSSSASPSNVGLWSYYPSRGNWNRE